jgi:hypothetical protein
LLLITWFKSSGELFLFLVQLFLLLLGEWRVVFKVRWDSICNELLLCLLDSGHFDDWEHFIDIGARWLNKDVLVAIPTCSFKPESMHKHGVGGLSAVLWGGLHYVSHFKYILKGSCFSLLKTGLPLDKRIEELIWIIEGW